jgi:hypothetical protein
VTEREMSARERKDGLHRAFSRSLDETLPARRGGEGDLGSLSLEAPVNDSPQDVGIPGREQILAQRLPHGVEVLRLKERVEEVGARERLIGHERRPPRRRDPVALEGGERAPRELRLELHRRLQVKLGFRKRVAQNAGLSGKSPAVEASARFQEPGSVRELEPAVRWISRHRRFIGGARREGLRAAARME